MVDGVSEMTKQKGALDSNENMEHLLTIAIGNKKQESHRRNGVREDMLWQSEKCVGLTTITSAMILQECIHCHTSNQPTIIENMVVNMKGALE